MDLLTYLQIYDPGELKPDGNGRYTTKTHSSLVISKGKWIWNRGGIGGISALDYLVKVQGMGFVSAVEQLAGADYTPIPPPEKQPETNKAEEKRNFKLPFPEKIPKAATAYLQSRGICSWVLRSAFRQKILYESKYWNPKSEFHNEKVCVFVGRDAQGIARFATMRGIHKDFKKDKYGSDKSINFCFAPKHKDCRTVAVFESPIDALSHKTISHMNGSFVDAHRLSLGGTSHVALIGFLERNKAIDHVILCPDLDDAGRLADKNIRKILAEDERFSHIKITADLPSHGKDFNEYLEFRVAEEMKENQQQNRPVNRADFSI